MKTMYVYKSSHGISSQAMTSITRATIPGRGLECMRAVSTGTEPPGEKPP